MELQAVGDLSEVRLPRLLLLLLMGYLRFECSFLCEPTEKRMIYLRRPDVPAKLQELQELTLKMGDFSEMAEDDNYMEFIAQLAAVVLEREDLKEFGSPYSEFLLKCCKELSVQVPILATYISLLAKDDSSFATLFRDGLEREIGQAIEHDQVATLKLLLKTVACLASAKAFTVDASCGIIAVLSPVLQACEAAIANSNVNEQAHVCFYLLLHTIPWCADVLAAHDDGKVVLERVLAVGTLFLSGYRSPFAAHGCQAMTTRLPDPDDEIAARLTVAPAQTDALNPGFADNLWEVASVVVAALTEMSAGASFPYPACMLTPWKTLIAEDHVATMQFSGEFGQHVFDALQRQFLGSRSRKAQAEGLTTYVRGDAAGSGRTTAWLRNRYPIFAADTTAEAAACAAQSALVRWTALTYFQDILQFFEPVVAPSGAKYGSLEVLVAQLLASLKLFPSDSHLEYLLTEFLFQVMLQPPINSAQHAMIGRILLHLSKNQPAFTQLIGLATNILFLLLPELDVTVARAVGDWFTFQFINSGYSWPTWSFWVDGCGLDEAGNVKTVIGEDGVSTGAMVADYDTLVTRLFCHGLTQKASRLVTYDSLKTKIPAAFHQYFDYDEVPKCSLFIADARAPGANPAATGYAAELRKLVEERLNGDDILDWMENLPQLSAEGNEKILLVMFVQTLCLVGAQSETLTTFLSLLDMYTKVFREFGDDEEFFVTIARAVFDACSHNAGMTVFLLQEMMNRSIISAPALAKLSAEEAVVRALSTEPLAYQLYELSVDHTLAVFKEAVLRRHRLGGGLVVDETADLTPSAEPAYIVRRPQRPTAMDADAAPTDANATVGTGATAQVSAEEEAAQVDFNEDDEDAEGRRIRRRVEGEDDGAEPREMSTDAPRGTQAPAAEEADEEERELDPLWISSEAAKIAIAGGRNVYRTLVTALVQLWELPADGETGLSTADLQALRAVSRSLLNRIWRSYSGLQTHLEFTLAQRVVVGDPAVDAEVARVLIAHGEEALVQSWSHFFHH